MCGIAGIAGEGARGHAEALRRMVAALSHRGPDASGTWVRDRCALGHARLSIVDLAGGAQPMEDATGTRAVTFNGEIYGFRELRDVMERAGRSFRTTSDTEVLLALYDHYGPALLRTLPGMFAFALFDERTGRLFAARDRFGEKPLFYARGRGGALVLASEIGAILASGLVEPVLSRPAVARYLQRLYTGPSATIWENVHALPPAHRLLFDARTGALEVDRYWSLPAPAGPTALDEAADRLRALLDRAVARQLVADVPVGAFLSGGLDSTTVVHLARAHAPAIATVSFGFEGSLDERPYARAVASAYGLRSLEVEELRVDVAGRLEDLAEVYDEPFADSSAIPTYEVCRAGRRHWKVALTGDGADELLGGYDFWYVPLWHAARSGLPGAELFWRTVKRLSRAAGLRRASRRARDRTLGLGLRRRFGGVPAAHDAQTRYVSDDALRSLGLPRPEPPPAPGGAGGLDDALRADVLDYLPGDILTKTDRASMAHGLELRAPFLDVELASFLVSLPSDLKVDGRATKVLLRRAFERDWPEPVRRRSKQGFAAPVREWLARPDVRPLLARTLGDRGSALHALLPFEATRPWAERADQTTWSLLVLGLWLERHPPAGATGRASPSSQRTGRAER